MTFTQEDFQKYSQQLQIIIMSKKGLDPMLNFKYLEPKQKRLFNEELNRYIQQLPTDFDTYILNDFNLVCNEEIFPFINTKYKNMFVRPSSNEELEKEQKEYCELIFKPEKLANNQFTETQLSHIAINDKIEKIIF